MTIEELNKKLNEIILRLQKLENDFNDLKNSEFGTGIYLDGCNQADYEYIVKQTEKVGK